MKIAVCQFASGTDKAANLAEIERLAADAAAEGARLAVFPEFAMQYTPKFSQEFVDEAEPLDGGFATALRGLAARYGISIVAGMHERIPGERRACNTIVVLGPDPERDLVAAYRKQHLYDAFGFKESDFLCAGPLGEPVTFEVDGVSVGLLTCYDLRFPEAARTLVDAGAQLLLYPAAWMPGPRKEDHWQTLARARAIENTVYVAAVSQTPPVGVGGSLVVDPNGVVLGGLGEASGTIAVNVEAERIERVRAFNPSLANRRYTVSPRV